ncbi:MAG TPA: hypothetical protein VGQ36_07970 [Thermoanaerobaculia bacterium]|nr:hypothetical protein [Thermoanaerobaculia bacterium]
MVVIYGAMYAWYISLPYNTGKLPEDVQSILASSGHGAVLSPGSPFYYVPFVSAMIACVGLLMLARWARTLLLVSTVAGLLIVPFAGVWVSVPFEAFIGSIAGILGPALLGIAYSSPIADKLSRGGGGVVPEEQEQGELAAKPDEQMVEVFHTRDQTLVAVLRSALEENDIHFSFVADTARLFVPERDAERVKEILHQLNAHDSVC